MTRTILIVDDSAINRQILGGMLSGVYDVIEAGNGGSALALLSQRGESVSAVLLDISMPDMDGYEVLRRIRANTALMQLPVVMVTGNEDEEARVKCLTLGANDFCMKPYNADIIRHCLRTNIALRESAAAARALQRDWLTGLYNRTAFFEIVQEMVAGHEPGYYILASFDIDKFKVINDQYGTAKGDEVLRHIGRVFSDGFETNGGVCCRISADDFAVLYPVTFQDSDEIAEIRRRVARTEGLAMPIKFSIGRYLVDDLSLSVSAMYDRASLAASSVNGRFGAEVATYDETMRERLLREQSVVMEMEDALRNRQFEVWYQPQYNHITAAMVGAEALVRWRHPTKGLIAPGVFIPLFERNGFISELDRFVWAEVCRSLRAWQDEGRQPLPVSVNISRYDMLNSDVVGVVTGLIREYGVPAELLRLEVTESAFAEETGKIIEVVRQLIEAGFTVEIDDFGSGYSSLNTLKDVPAQILKLDMHFLESNNSERGGNIVESVVRMAKWLGMSIVAEGVETREQADFMTSIGCSCVQGYLYARPMPLGQYDAHFASAVQAELLMPLETVENLNNNRFWDPSSMDTLIFNSYVGAACIFEYTEGNIELLRANKKFMRIFGDGRIPIEEIAKLNWLRFLSDESHDRARAALQKFGATHEEFTEEYTFKGIPGIPGQICIRATVRVIARAGNRMLAYCMSENITEQKRRAAELAAYAEQLRVSEDENRLALSLAKNTICRFNIADRTLTIPPEAAAARSMAEIMTGVPMSPVLHGLIAPESEETYIGFYESIAGGSKTATAVYRHKFFGDWRWSEARAATIFSAEGTPVKAVITFQDVTERQEKETVYKKWQQSLEAKAHDSYSMYRLNLNNTTATSKAQGGLVTFDFAGAGRDFNSRTRAYAKTRVFEEDRAVFIQFANSDVMLASYYRGKRTDALTYRELLPDGGTRWLRLTVDLVEFPNSTEVEAYMLYEDIDFEKRAELLTRELSELDHLTGLLNRQTFVEKASRYAREDEDVAFALFIIDLDGFKLVNDSFGHAAGDETLIEISRKLQSVFRERDLLCRLGGDEFMVCMRDVTHLSAVKDRAALVCALLHKSFSLNVQLSASVGIAISPDDGCDFDTLYRKADAAMYHVKNGGKDGYAIYTAEMAGAGENRQLSQALDDTDDESVRAEPMRRMIIVAGNEKRRDYLASLFEDEFIIETAAEDTAALARLRRYGAGISMVLLEVRPGPDAFAMLDQMRASPITQSIPVIVVSGLNDHGANLEAIKRGASEFVRWPVDAELLRVRVNSALSRLENERLLARNRYLSIQNEEAKRLAEAKRHSEELTVALREAERADLARTQFLSSMSHEMRTPLNAVIGYNILARNELSEANTEAERRHAEMKALDCLTKSEVASRHLLSIINDVLDMSAIESGRLKVEKLPFDFRSLITSLTVMFFSQARAKGVSFEVRFDKPVDEWFTGDQLRINQILTNLLSNAVKFTPEGGSVTLGVTETRRGDDTVDFSFVVEDTGIGMTQEYLAHIWTPFEQEEASVTRRFGGTGLGLSITKNLVELMGGSIAVESESGVGSRFTVELTLSTAQQPKQLMSRDFSGINALVVDDDAGTCDYIKLLFDRCRAGCTTCTSGAEAVRVFAAAKEEGKPFNICLVDWRMPGMNGFETIAEIRRIAAMELPIVVVTAYDFSEVSDQVEALSINRFVAKPLFQSSLFDVLANITGRQTEAAPDKGGALDFNGRRVLLVEDNNMNMEVAKRILMSAGLDVDSAWNGREAVEIFTASKAGTYSAILMDVHMPEMDGYQATRIIRSSNHPDGASVPIIAMTADVFAEDISEARSAGMNAHIAKPIDLDSLFKTLSDFIGKDGQ